MEKHDDGSIVAHPFEVAGLGKAPFEYIGCERKILQACQGEPVKPGGTCDYCSNAIMYCYNVESADGKRFHVGCDCIRRISDTKLYAMIESDVRKHKREQRQQRETEKCKEIESQVNAVRSTLGKIPHPNGYFASIGKTFWDYLEFCICGKSDASKIRLYKYALERAKKWE